MRPATIEYRATALRLAITNAKGTDGDAALLLRIVLRQRLKLLLESRRASKDASRLPPEHPPLLLDRGWSAPVASPDAHQSS